LARHPSGEIALEGETGPPWRLIPTDKEWRVEVGGGSVGWLLRRSRSPGSRFVLVVEADERELGRTLALESVGLPPELRYFLMGDGRLFRFALRGPVDCRFELSGRETPGAYLTARPQSDGWRIEASPASGGIEDLRALSVLFAAEILDAEEPSGLSVPLRA
jgi:hypothetical protein